MPASARWTGPPPRSWPTRRSSPTASPSGSPARTSSAARSRTGMPLPRRGHRRGVRSAAVHAERERGLRDPQQPADRERHIGFEFGYNIQEPNRLVLWEAQYGDFINGAQVILDEFLTSGRAKWGLAPSLVLLLPHGYEGQGPDHSSARLERFLNAAADTNMRIANCTTAAQYFHLLRRQAELLTTDPLPLIVMTPKSLLRHAATASSPAELAEGRFQLVIDDPAVARAGQGASARALQREDLRGPRRRRGSQGTRVRLPDAGGAALPVPGGSDSGSPRSPPKAAGGLLGAGGAGEHGRMGVRAPAAGTADRRALAAPLHRPRPQLQPVGRVVQLARRQPACHRRETFEKNADSKEMDRVLSKQV